MARARKRIGRRELKGRLRSAGSADVMELVADLYDSGEANRAFIEARLQLSDDALAPYKKRIREALYPDLVEGGRIRLGAGRKAISDYRRAARDSEGVIDLLIYYVEIGTKLTLDYGVRRIALTQVPPTCRG